MSVHYQRGGVTYAVSMVAAVNEFANRSPRSLLHGDSVSVGTSSERFLLVVTEPQCHGH
jgi:hypothetical protein